jgi:hypothetical protein
MIKLRFHEDNTTGLVATCDVCGDLVSGEFANLLWRPSGVEGAGDYFEYKIACDFRCTAELDLEHGYHHSQELGTAIGYLVKNTKTDISFVNNKQEHLALIG